MEQNVEVEQVVIYPPNRPLEREFVPSKVPVMYQYLLFTDVNKAGEFIVGCSNIGGAYWEGTLFYYKDAASTIDQKYSNFFISDSSTSDGRFFTEDRILLAEDSGRLRLLKVPEVDNIPLKCEIAYDGTDMIEKIAVWGNNYNVLTCSENSVYFWTLTDEVPSNPIHVFRNYHTELVTDVDTKKDDEDIFVSVSVDRKAVLWDLRQSIKPASVLYSNEFGALTAISWCISESDYLAVGSEGGDIYLLDIRQPKDFVSVAHGFNNRVHRLKFNDTSNLAVAADTAEFLVLSNDKTRLTPIYRNRVHKGFVRGLSWHDNLLYTCAFDGKVLKHNISDTF